MTYEDRQRLGPYRDEVYYRSLRAEPRLNDPEEFAVVLFRDTTDGEKVQIARIDTEHGYPHFDRLYRRDQVKDPVDMDFWDAWNHLEANWRTYVQSHERESMGYSDNRPLREAIRMCIRRVRRGGRSGNPAGGDNRRPASAVAVRRSRARNRRDEPSEQGEQGVGT